MQDDGKEAPLFQPFDEWPVHVLHMLLEDVIEIAHRLMEVDAENEAKRIQSGAFREAEPPRHFAESLRADTVELGLHIERNVQVLKLE